MRFLVFILPAIYRPTGATLDETKAAPDGELMAKMGRFHDELKAAGAVMAVDGLQPLTRAARLAFNEGNMSVAEGSHNVSQEVIGGYWLLQSTSKRQVIDWMKKCPVQPRDVIEIRQVPEVSDFSLEVQTVLRDR